MQQLLVVVFQGLRNLEHQLRQVVTVLCLHIHISHTNHMEHHIIISWVVVVSVTIPVTGLEVYLHIAHPQRATNLHLRVEKVGPCIAVVQSCVQNLNHTPVSSLQLIERQHLVFPNIVKQLFHD